MKKVLFGSMVFVLTILFVACVTIPPEEVDAFIYRIITNIWERGDRGITADVLFDNETAMEGLLHIWLNGPGIVEDSFDALEEDTDEDPLRVLSTCPLVLDYEFTLADIYTFRFEYDNRPDAVRNASVENIEQTYVNTLQPLPYVTYLAPVDIDVSWDLSNDHDQREIEVEFYDLWVDDLDNGFIGEFEIPDPVDGEYTVTLPSSIFEVNKRYSINIARETRYVGNSHYHKQLVASRAIRFGEEWEDFQLSLQLQRYADQDRNPLFYLQVECGHSDFIQPEDCEKVILSGQGIVDGEWQLRYYWEPSLFWYDTISDEEENLVENHVFQTGDEYTADIYGKENVSFRSRINSIRNEIIGTDSLALGVIPSALVISNDWRQAGEENPHVFEQLCDLALEWEYEGIDENDFIVRLSVFDGEEWVRVTSVRILCDQNEHTFSQQLFTAGCRYSLDIYKFFGDYDDYSAIPVDRCYFNFQAAGSGSAISKRSIHRFFEDE